jgi:uncharacterized protein (TIGR03643 family)
MGQKAHRHRNSDTPATRRRPHHTEGEPQQTGEPGVLGLSCQPGGGVSAKSFHHRASYVARAAGQFANGCGKRFGFQRLHITMISAERAPVAPSSPHDLDTFRLQITVLYRKERAVMRIRQDLSEATRSEIIDMALSDHVGFADIRAQHGLREDEVKALMRASLKPASYRAWRRRVRKFADRREVYK